MDDYLYTGNNPPLTFTMNPFIVEPAECGPITKYTCEMISGSHTDLCTITDGSTTG